MSMIAIIGGSGLENPNILKNSSEVEVNTPYGCPSSPFKIGNIEGVKVAILSRHGYAHEIPPSQVNNRANLWAIKKLGCTKILATTACGSLRQNIKRGDIVILDQFIDFTRHREITFHEKFERNSLKHTPMAEPFDEKIRKVISNSAEILCIDHHKNGTVITIEGPRFSTRAESNMFRLWGADVINMSIAPECILANEIGIPYAAIALSTDYDCWKEEEEPVTCKEVFNVFERNVEKVILLMKKAIVSL